MTSTLPPNTLMLILMLHYKTYYLNRLVKLKTVSFDTIHNLVRAERIELSSFAWKADILAIIRRPHIT